MKWLTMFLLFSALVLIPATTRAQGCAGVTATQEDGSIKCFPPVDAYADGWADSVEYSGTGLAMAYRRNDVIGSTDAICVGCVAVVISAPGRTNFDLAVVEQSTYGSADRTYYRPSLPSRYDAATDRSTASYVMHMPTTVSLIVVGARTPVTIDPYWQNVD